MKKKRIGILLDDRKINNIDLSFLENGNMGIGGTEYCFAMLIYYANKLLSTCQIVVFHYNNTVKFARGVENIILNDSKWNQFLSLEIDILIFRAGFFRNEDLLEFVNNNNIVTIVWAHNYFSNDIAKEIARCDAIKRVVFVGKQMYEHYIDHDIINKSTYIYNMVSIQESRSKDYESVVVFTGSIMPVKGFHLLAREWKKILRQVPDARLYVVGNGKLYNEECVLGKYGIAEESYERRFIHYLLDKEKKIDNSVSFLGKLGVEKYELYRKAAVGIMNPSGRTETFGLSAVEMEKMGIPVVEYNKSSYPDIIKSNVTGYLCKSRREFRNRIIDLLKNREKNREMGENAKQLVDSKFEPSKILKDWDNIFCDILNDKDVIYEKPKELLVHDFKWLRVINRKIKKKFNWWPSLVLFDEISRKGNYVKEFFARHISRIFPY